MSPISKRDWSRREKLHEPARLTGINHFRLRPGHRPGPKYITPTRSHKEEDPRPGMGIPIKVIHKSVDITKCGALYDWVFAAMNRG